ncbi:FKBP-type peptidyl-prolyl cis-trans isomerase N-terminal domain-containing protein [Serratia sp. NA_112.1]|uniref:FKBP-type peptidyl-prolyl cis-trans isomerase N-terminal domain-containing protein n=1 Tax=unclassified Serratia (in: enterobacteria) TaxID=2647522 RepID=UPI00404701DD
MTIGLIPFPLRSSPLMLGLMMAIGLTTSGSALATPKAGIPAILQFAEQYQQQSTVDNTPKKEKAPAQNSHEVSGTNPQLKKSVTTTTRWQTKEAEIQRQQGTIDRLEREVAALKKTLALRASAPAATVASPPQPPVDLQQWGKLAQGLRQALALTPNETQARERLRLAQQQQMQAQTLQDRLQSENQALKTRLSTLKTQQQVAVTDAQADLKNRLQAAEQDRATLQTHLSEAQNSTQSLNATTENLKAQLARAKTTEAELRQTQTQQQQQQNKLQQQHTTLQTELDANITRVADLTAELTALQKVVPAKIQAESLKQPSVRQDYAAGVSLGEEILQMHAERQRWGVNVDKKTLLAGLIDTFNGQRQLDEPALNQALADSEKQVTKARENVFSTQKKQGDAYLATFKKDKRVKTTAGGAWYRIDYAGDNPIPPDATLDVVVKETLTDGTVIQDMEANDSVLSQSLAQFPPLFADALRQLNNHGSLTLVVPPALAYGDKGYPPNVPPNATMVYTLRIAEVYPATQKKKATPEAASPSR